MRKTQLATPVTSYACLPYDTQTINKNLLTHTTTHRHIMNTLHNKVQLVGHLGRNPEVKTLQSGAKIVKMLLATNEYRKNDKGEKVTHTIWHNLTAWGTTADIAAKYLIKGKKVMVCGKLSQDVYTDKQGIKRTATQIILSEINMVG
jgi:single-strand DNA-binding protein